MADPTLPEQQPGMGGLRGNDGPDRRAAMVGARRRHWLRARRMTGWLLALWMLTWFVSIFFARELSRITLFGWPLSFYLAAQGAALVFLAIVGFYCWRMRRIDSACRRELE